MVKELLNSEVSLHGLDACLRWAWLPVRVVIARQVLYSSTL